MSESTLAKTLALASPEALSVRLPSGAYEFLKTRLSPDVLGSLAEASLSRPVQLGPIHLSKLAEVAENHNEPTYQQCLNNGFIVLGHGLNGDPVALNASTGRMVFLDHDLLFEDDFDEFAECVVETPWNLDEFLVRAASDPKFPRDAYDAEQLQEKD